MAREITWNTQWTGSTDTDFGTAGNWADASIPAASDNLLVTASNRDIAGSDESAVDLSTLWFDRRCVRPAGSAGSPLILAANNVVLEGRGTKVIKAGGAGIDYLTVNMEDQSELVLVHPAATNLLTNLFAWRGTVQLQAEAGVITLGRIGRNARFKSEIGAGGFTQLIVDGAQVVSNALITTLHLREGSNLTHENGASATITNAHVASGATLNFDYPGTITLLTAGPGAIVDLNRTGDNKTITTAVLHPDAIIRAGVHVTISNLYYGEG